MLEVFNFFFEFQIIWNLRLFIFDLHDLIRRSTTQTSVTIKFRRHKKAIYRIVCLGKRMVHIS